MVGHLSAQLHRQTSSLSPARLVLQDAVQREDRGLPEKTNPLLMRIDYIECVAQDVGQRFNHLLGKRCSSLGLKSA